MMYISEKLVSLADLMIGATCKISSVELTGLLRRRVLDLGMIPGTTIECVRRSSAGDPIAFRVRGTTIALRSEDASQIKVYPA
jgi:ferrous iron transport protein A